MDRWNRRYSPQQRWDPWFLWQSFGEDGRGARYRYEISGSLSRPPARLSCSIDLIYSVTQSETTDSADQTHTDVPRNGFTGWFAKFRVHIRSQRVEKMRNLLITQTWERWASAFKVSPSHLWTANISNEIVQCHRVHNDKITRSMNCKCQCGNVLISKREDCQWLVVTGSTKSKHESG